MMDLYLDRSGTIDETWNLGRSQEHLRRIAQLEGWMHEDKLACDFCCQRSVGLWRDDLLKRLANRVLPMRVKMPRCLANVNGLMTQHVWITEDLSVRVAIHGKGQEWFQGSELCSGRQ